MKKKKVIRIIISAALSISMVGTSAVYATEEEEIIFMDGIDAQAVITGLQTEGLTNPIGIDTATPSFTWTMESNVTGAAQSAYQIIVKDEADQELWNSGVVESSDSVDIPYEGEELAAATKYYWSVAVTDTAGNTVTSETASFETSLLSDSIEAFGGAEWIGNEELSLDAASQCIFEIDSTLEIPEGSTKASYILGADDYRLENEAYNVEAVNSDENYMKVEFDYSDVTADGGAKINFYRCGYYKDDDPAVPVYTIEENEDLNGVITAANVNDPHDIKIYVSGSLFTITVDDVTLKDTCSLNKLGDSASYNSFPNLNSIGFSVDEGQKAIITDYRVENSGKYASGVLFGENTGATYSIFDGFENTTIEGNVITIEGSMLDYADPTYGAAPMVRKEFETKGEIASARLYLTAQGIYDFYMNGEEVAADEWFNPGAEEYDQLMAYNVYDVTDYLTEGTNAMGAVLGEGWWTGQMTFETSNYNYYGDQPALLAMLVVRYADGTEDTIVSDESWTSYNDGPVRLASFFQGERYDATKESSVEGWTSAGFDSSSWSNAAVIETRKQFADTKFETRDDNPVHVIDTLTAQECLGETKEGTDAYIYDMGKNVSGVPVITIPEEYAAEGQTITIRFAEVLYPDLEEYTSAGIDGTLAVENYRAALVTDFYTMKAGEQVYAPDLTFHGYRYIEITGLGKELPAEYVQMQVLSSLDSTATYTSSNELANQLFENIQNSTTSNYISIPTDCPQRNERMGWTGDAQIFALSGSYMADTYEFLSEWMNTVRADCGEDTGLSSQYCPAFVQYDPEADDTIAHNGQSFGITWNCLVVTIPYNLYMQTGKLDIVEDNIENIYTYVDHLNDTPLSYKDADGEKQSDDRLTGETGTLADHLARVTTDSVLLGNVLYYMCLNEAATLAEAVGDTEKADAYTARAEVVKEAWNELFIDSETGLTYNLKGVLQDTQASYATPLRYGIISDENLEKVLANYVKTIENPETEDSDGNAIDPYTITTGFNATGNVLNALSDYGYNDVAYQLFESTDYASWLYPVTQGATSIWERWNSYTEEDGFGGNNSMNSFNHYSLGAVYEWMIGYQVGITSGEDAGYQHFVLQPTTGGTFENASGRYNSEYGIIYSGWTAADGVMTGYDVTVPANTTATLYLPVSVSESEVCNGVTDDGAAVHNCIDTEQYTLMAGTYHFEIQDGKVTVTASSL